MKTTELVVDAISPLFEGLDIHLMDVEYTKKHDGMHLTVYIDKVGGITVEDCQYVSRMVDDVLDEVNPTNDASYYLDVSSYGLDKPLKQDWQFERYIDKKVTVKLYKKVNDLKEFDAILKSYKDAYKFELNGEEIEIEKELVAQIVPFIEF